MPADVVIINSGGANIASLRFALDRLGASTKLSLDPATIASAARVILPGVGAARDAMDRLRAARLASLIPELTQPVLGICLGMQLLYTRSGEDDTECLSIAPGTAERFPGSPEQPVPHMGWNQVFACKASALLHNIVPGAYFYFVHSYAVPPGPATVGTADYGGDFTAVCQWQNFVGTQFHPERSGKNGALLLQNFLDWHC